jgi:Glyoxalase-like domain
MIASRASLDHLTVAALTLEQGIAHVQRALGVAIPPGGSHPLMATHNHLMQLGNGIFLEVIAPDHTVTPQRTRWFGLDDPRMRASLKNSPRLISWVARVPDLAQALREIHGAIGEVVAVTRGPLTWLISVPRDGSMPFDGAFPTLIEWPGARIPRRAWRISVVSLKSSLSSIPKVAAFPRCSTRSSLTIASSSRPVIQFKSERQSRRQAGNVS